MVLLLAWTISHHLVENTVGVDLSKRWLGFILPQNAERDRLLFRVLLLRVLREPEDLIVRALVEEHLLVVHLAILESDGLVDRDRVHFVETTGFVIILDKAYVPAGEVLLR